MRLLVSCRRLWFRDRKGGHRVKASFFRAAGLLTPVLGIAVATAASAQVNTATISGQVIDTSGAAVSQTRLLLHNTATGVDRTLVSDNAGRFTFTFVAVGSYTLKASHTGFLDELAPSFELTAGQALALPIQLQVRGEQTTVTVNGATEALQTTSSSQDTTVSEQQLNKAPVLHEDWTNTLQFNSATFKLTAAGSSSF